jgi:PASTA domain
MNFNLTILLFVTLQLQDISNGFENSLKNTKKNSVKSFSLCEIKIIQEKIKVPNLIGLTLKDAKKLIQNSSLELASIIHDTETNSINLDKCFVIKQNPSPKNERKKQNYIQKGGIIDLWIAEPISMKQSVKTNSRKVKTFVKD